MTGHALVLFAHGSRDPRWARPFNALAADLAGDLAPVPVRLAFMEFAGPTLKEVAAELAGSGCTRLRLLPLFLAGGAHVARDIPAQVAEVKALHPELEVTVLPPVGENPRFRHLMREVAREAAGDPAPAG